MNIHLVEHHSVPAALSCWYVVTCVALRFHETTVDAGKVLVALPDVETEDVPEDASKAAISWFRGSIQAELTPDVGLRLFLPLGAFKPLPS